LLLPTSSFAASGQKKTRRLLLGGLLKLGLITLYAPSARAPPTLQVPFVGTRFRVVVGLVAGHAIIEAEV
jgi:hypothetical protein